MKVRLTSLSLLIPAVVLAQPAPQAPTTQPSQAGGMMQSPQINSANSSSALNNAKQQTKELKNKTPSKGDSADIGCTESSTILDSGC